MILKAQWAKDAPVQRIPRHWVSCFHAEWVDGGSCFQEIAEIVQAPFHFREPLGCQGGSWTECECCWIRNQGEISSLLIAEGPGCRADMVRVPFWCAAAPGVRGLIDHAYQVREVPFERLDVRVCATIVMHKVCAQVIGPMVRAEILIRRMQWVTWSEIIFKRFRGNQAQLDVMILSTESFKRLSSLGGQLIVACPHAVQNGWHRLG